MDKQENMFMLKEYRNLGIGTRLYEEFNKWCKKKKVGIIRVQATAKNQKAVDFYRKNNFKGYTLILESKI